LSGPVTAHSQIEQQKLGVIEDPLLALKIGWRDGVILLIIHKPTDAIGIPLDCINMEFIG